MLGTMQHLRSLFKRGIFERDSNYLSVKSCLDGNNIDKSGLEAECLIMAKLNYIQNQLDALLSRHG